MSKFEKPKNECPSQCKFCDHCKTENWNGTEVHLCTANGCITHTFDFSRPYDRPLPIPLNCFWWYLHDFGNKEKQKECHEKRLHEITAWKAINSGIFDHKSRKEFGNHFHRGGGGGLIDFKIYPELLLIYEEVLRWDKE